MDMKSRNQYLKSLVEKRGYLLASKKEKGCLLKEFCANTGMNKKYVITKIRSGQYLKSGTKQQRNRKSTYTNEAILELRRLWRIFDYACGQRLQPTLETEVDRLLAMGELTCPPDIARQLKTISAKTIDRKLASTKKDEGLKNKYQKKIHPLLYQRIPIKVFADQDRNRLGIIQADLVEHCGQSAHGSFAHTISTTDICSGWWRERAVIGRDQRVVHAGLSDLKNHEYPFIWQMIHTDNDTSFINDLFYRYCQKDKLEFTRSRPYKKNDNCLVEEKNRTHVRQLVGYRRYDTLEELEILNELYEKVADFKNFFQPAMKLVRKERIGSHIRRHYDRPRTPYQRVMMSRSLSDEIKRELHDYYNSLNPVRLKRELTQLQTDLYEAYLKKQEKSKGRSVRLLADPTKALSVR